MSRGASEGNVEKLTPTDLDTKCRAESPQFSDSAHIFGFSRFDDLDFSISRAVTPDLHK